jgi:cleavage and polyadenylation specificity factor subunit 2
MDAPLIPVDACKEFLLEPVSRPTVYIGTIMLSRLKDAMAKAGIRAELAGGILCVENHDTGAVVLVKKTASQSVVLEGALCEEYYAVRDVLVSQLVSIPDM